MFLWVVHRKTSIKVQLRMNTPLTHSTFAETFAQMCKGAWVLLILSKIDRLFIPPRETTEMCALHYAPLNQLQPQTWAGFPLDIELLFVGYKLDCFKLDETTVAPSKTHRMSLGSCPTIYSLQPTNFFNSWIQKLLDLRKTRKSIRLIDSTR